MIKMRSMNIRRFLIIVLACGFAACGKEEHPVPTEGLEPFFSLPQGNHDYDNTIMTWHEKYGFYALYKFEHKDVYWNNNGWNELRPMADWDLRGGLLGEPADTNYVGQQLEMIQAYFLDRFPEEYLHHLPLKMFLCSELWTGEYKAVFQPSGEYETELITRPIWNFSGYGSLAITGGGAAVEQYNAEDKLAFAQSIGCYFGGVLIDKEVLTPPDEFFEIAKSAYVSSSVNLSGVNLFKVGLLNKTVVKATSTVESSLKNDFISYVSLVIGNTYAKLNGTPGTITDYNNPAVDGVFDVTRDVNGLVKQKYDIVAAYLRDKGIDVEFYQDGE